MMRFRSYDRIALVSRTMNTTKAAFSKSVNMTCAGEEGKGEREEGEQYLLSGK